MGGGVVGEGIVRSSSLNRGGASRATEATVSVLYVDLMISFQGGNPVSTHHIASFRVSG